MSSRSMPELSSSFTADGCAIFSGIGVFELHRHEIIFVPLAAHEPRFGVGVHSFQNGCDLVGQTIRERAEKDTPVES